MQNTTKFKPVNFNGYNRVAKKKCVVYIIPYTIIDHLLYKKKTANFCLEQKLFAYSFIDQIYIINCKNA